LKLDLKSDICFFNFCSSMNFLIIHVVFEIFWLKICFFVVQELFGHYTFNFTHCILFAKLHCVFFLAHL
jgi:hypothetical protein